MTTSLSWIATLVLAATLLAGCGGGGGGETAPAPNITAAAGGTVKSADGRVALVVPAGAAGRDMTVRIVSATPSVPGDIGVLAGYGYAIEGDGGDLGADATLEFTVEPAALALEAVGAAARIRALGVAGLPPPPPECGPGYTLTQSGAPPALVFICTKNEPEAATLSAGVLTKIDTCRFITGAAKLACTIKSLLPQSVVLLYDKTPPTLDVEISTSSVTAAGDVTFTVNMADNKGLGVLGVIFHTTDAAQVTVYPQNVGPLYFVGPQAKAASFTFTRAFTTAQNGDLVMRSTLYDKNGNKVILDKVVTVTIPNPAASRAGVSAPLA